MEKGAIRVLIVDQPEDAERIAGELRTAGMAFEAVRVERESELLTALETFEPDVALSEHRLPGLAWTTVLGQLDSKCPGVPVIIVTNSADAEPSAECIRAGAADYVVKDHVGRLAPAVLSALERARLRAESERVEARRQRVESDLAGQLALLRAVLDSSDAAMFAVDRQLRYVAFNRAHALSTKDLYGGEAAIGASLEAVLSGAGADRARIHGNLTRVLAGEPLVEEAEHGGEGRPRRWLAVSYNPVRARDGRVTGAVVVAQDISERRRQEERLRQLSQAVEQSPVSIAIVDGLGAIEYVNPKLEQVTGYAAAELIGTTLPVLKAGSRVEKGSEAVWASLAAQGEWSGELPSRRKDGTFFWENVHVAAVRAPDGRISNYLALNEDVTERKRASEALKQTERMLMQAQKMEAVGRLAGGIAHDFNNLLSVVLGHAERLSEELGAQHPSRARVEQILWSADKAATLTRQLLAFGRRQVLEPRVIRLDAVVADARQMLERVIGEDVDLVVAQPASLGSVRADPGQLVQVLLNLAVNARDAMPRGGRLVLEFADVELDERYARGHPPLTAGSYVMMAVSDSGQGMDADTQRQIFEPFFSTKPEGQGSGLGLCTVYGIVKQSGGFVWVYSEVGVGTTFKVYLPRVDAPAEEVTATVQPPVAPLPPGDGARILLVEDDDGVRELMSDVLKDHGYVVIACSRAGEALELVGANDSVDLVVTDVIMPGMSGRELVQHLRGARPAVKVLYVSGYAGEALARHGGIERGERFLQKPFSERGLLESVASALADQGGGPPA